MPRFCQTTPKKKHTRNPWNSFECLQKHIKKGTQGVPEIFSNCFPVFFQTTSKTKHKVSSDSFKWLRKQKWFVRFFQITSETSTTGGPRDCFKLLQKPGTRNLLDFFKHFRNQTRNAEILSNYSKNKSEGILEILSNDFKAKTKGVYEIQSISKTRDNGCPRFFQTTSKTKHNGSPRFFQTTSKTKHAISNILSSCFKNISKMVPENLSNHLKIRYKGSPRFFLLQKLQQQEVPENYIKKKHTHTRDSWDSFKLIKKKKKKRKKGDKRLFQI